MRVSGYTFTTDDRAGGGAGAPPPLPGGADGRAAPIGQDIGDGEKAIRKVLEDELRRKIHERLIEFMDLRRLDISKIGDEGLRRRTEEAVREIIAQMGQAGEIPGFIDKAVLAKDTLDEALGLGPLEEYMADESITEVMVNNCRQLYIERDGLLELVQRTFSSDQAVMGVIERIVAPLGRRIDESSPMVDARLKDGSRVNAIIPPLALKGPSITIRKFKKDKMTVDDLMAVRSIAGPMVDFLKACVHNRKNCIISGGTGSGKTTLLNALSTFIPEGERIVTIEDAAELQLKQDHWVALEARPPNIEGKGQITIRDLVKNSLRMRPDRIVVGECRGGEALDMLQAMNTGHDGSLTTIHSNSPRDTLARLETMVLMSGMDLPVRAIREQVASAINMIIHLSRFPDGSRKVTQITEITGMEVDVITMQDIFQFKQEGFDDNGRVRGKFIATGNVPKFYDDLQKRGIKVDLALFR
jgi:pilus assembly protein CpaF